MKVKVIAVQNVINFLINNKIIVILILIFMISVVIGFFGNRRLEKKKKNDLSYNDKSNIKVNSQIDEVIDTLEVDSSNNISTEFQNINSIYSESDNIQIDSVDQNSSVQTNSQVNSNTGIITSEFYIPDDNNINNIF